MDTAILPGRFWKTPFVWQPGCPEPPICTRLWFEPADDLWLHLAQQQVMSTSLSEDDQYSVAKAGAAAAVDELMSLVPKYFVRPDQWWRVARTFEGLAIGFVLPVLFRYPERGPGKTEQPEGTIFHMGVLPRFRGNGYALDLVHEATRLCLKSDCWRVFCDTSSRNTPMINAFRRAGYIEREPWLRPLA